MSIRDKLILFVFFLFGCMSEALYAQGEGNIWYFGNKAGLDFNTTPPTPLLDGQVNTSEGCASISDPSGSLLFYTDGIKVWDRTHTQMPNGFGLLGDPSSAQSGVIIPMPGNDSIYYLFTTPDYQSPSIGFRYTIIDMNLNGGLGDVVISSKNTLLFSPSSEKLAASFHCNNKDIWVVGRSNQDFYSYLITASGISATPIITSGITNPAYPYPYGMKSSSNGKKIAANYYNANVSELYDFDISTGLLSNPVTLYHSSSDYGSEFSPDGTKLYISLISSKQIYQYDLTAADINASAIAVGTTGGQYTGMPQLASDGKIYISEYQSGAVAIIHNPNALGTSCNLQPGALNLGGRNGTFGFPTMISNFFSTPVNVLTADTTCFSSPSDFSLSGILDEDSIRWDFGDPSTGIFNTDTGLSVSHVYSAAGNFSVQAIVYYPCRSDTIYDTIYIAPVPTAAFSAANTCGTVPVLFQDSSSVSSGSIAWDWDFGDGSAHAAIANPSHSYNTIGNYSVILIVTSEGGCKDTVSRSINSHPLPVTNLDGNNVCLNAFTAFSDLSIANNTISNWDWNFGDGDSSALQNPQHTYTSPGTYPVSLAVTNNFGCKDTNTTTVLVHPLPVSNFSSAPECLNDSTCFSDLSTIASGAITGWSWNFADLPSGLYNNSALQNPCHVFTGSGVFNVALTVISDSGCQHAVQLPATIHPLPVAGFTSNTPCLHFPSAFTDTSSLINGDTLSSWDWNFGDGSAHSADSNPSHTYSTSGNYSVMLIATSDEGCIDTVVQSVTVHPLPVSNLSGNNVCLNEVSVFSDLSLANNTATNWDWSFGDGDSAISQNPAHTYTNPGTYTVSLTITNNFGCKDTNTTTVVIHPLPSANFSSVPVCLHDTTCFSDVSAVSSGAVTAWSWNFGDVSSGLNNNSNLQNPCHVFTTSGSFNVVLTVTSDSGCQNTAQLPATIHHLPVAGFTAGNSCLNSPVFFTDTSILIDGDTINSWSWNFGEGPAASGAANPSYTYNAAGDYSVTLSITTNKGCFDTVNHSVTVYSNPVAGFSYPDSGCAPVCTQFTDLSQTLSGSITNWDWSFSGGNPSQAVSASPAVCWNTPGSYDVQLIVTTNHGCKDTMLMPAYIRVFPFPVADFCMTPAQNSVNTPFFSFCNLWSPDVVSWTWDFGDDSSLDSASTSPVHNYSATVTNNDFYSGNVCLYVQNQYGCRDSICKTVELFPEFSFFMPNTFTPNEDNANELFFGRGIGVKEYNIRLFDRFGTLIWSCEYKGKNTDWDNNGQDGMPSACKWDGIVQGGQSNQMVKEDVYVWKVQLTDIFDRVHDYIGHVTVVK